MRYCPECLRIFETEGNVCAECNVKTIDIGAMSNQVPLFPPADTDRVKSVYDCLKGDYREKLEGLTKAERKLKDAQCDLDRAAHILLDYDAVIKGKAMRGLPEYEGEKPVEEDILLVGDGTEVC